MAASQIWVTLMQSPSRRMLLRSFIALSVGAGLPRVALAGHGGCRRCGCSTNRCRKVCRLEQVDRKITTVVWGMECEDFCVPGPSTPDCKQCDMVGSPVPGDKVCSKPKRIVWTSWIPGCGQEIHTKRKLMKKTVTKNVPSFKWVVGDLCPDCMASCERVKLPQGALEPRRPEIEGLTFLGAEGQDSTCAAFAK